MSKSVGNVVDPMPVIDQYGSDALRMGIIVGRSPAVNRGYDPRKIEDARNFCNKLWNIARFIENIVGEDFAPAEAKPETAADHWILNQLSKTTTVMSKLLDDYRFSEAYDLVYHFIWDDLADWYIEASKAQPNNQLLVHILEQSLALTHPFAPFLTETIWQALGWRNTLLINHSWPKAQKTDAKQVRAFEEIKAIVTESRYIIKTLRVNGVTLYHTGESFLTDNSELIAKLAGLQGVVEVKDGAGLHLTSTPYRCWLDIDRNAALTFVDELEKKLEAQDALITQLEGRLANKSYVDNAPRHVVAQTKEQLNAAKELRVSIAQERDRFSQD